MTKSYCIKNYCKSDGTIVKCNAIRGLISSDDESIQKIPLKINYKKINKSRYARFNLLKFKIKKI